MKKGKHKELICGRFCRFYKEDREEMTCGTYNYLAEKFTPEVLESKIDSVKKRPDFSCDEEIKKIICKQCEFFVDGCDFREGLDSPPCGGYTVVEWLLKHPVKK